MVDGTDNCTTVFNPDQTNTDSGAETAAAGESGDACDALTDRDGDTIADGSDNCVAVANTDQADADNDGVGDLCETSNSDGDSILDYLDNCPSVDNETPDRHR